MRSFQQFSFGKKLSLAGYKLIEIKKRLPVLLLYNFHNFILQPVVKIGQ